MKSNCQIKSLNVNEFSIWDQYVTAHKQGTFFHLSGWHTVIQQSFNHACFYVYAEQDGVIKGVLPLVEVKSALFGHALISTPFCVYGGAITDSPEITQLLEQHACELAEKLEVDYLELRYKEQQNSSLLLKQASSTFGCELQGDAEKVLAAVKKKQRAVIRHSLNNELTYSEDDGKNSYHFNQFYDLLSVSYRNLGTPIFSKNYFEQLVAVFGEQLTISVIKIGRAHV